MRILIVNRFMPPDEAPTAVLAGELAQHLRTSGHEVACVASSANYRTKGRFKLPRAFEELVSHIILFAKMVFTPKADLLICLSSPTCLAVTAALASKLRHKKFAHWAMDVYPDVAVQLGEIRDGGVMHRVTRALMHWAYGKADTLVALDEDMQSLFAMEGHHSSVCGPWTPLGLDWPEKDSEAGAPDKPIRWVYSGNLGRAHEWRSLLEAQKLLESECPGAFELVFQGGGASQPAAKSYADELDLQACQWVGYAPKEGLLESLFDADVLVATQTPSTKGLLWPSKLAVVRHVPRPILWVGPIQSAVSSELSSRPLTATIGISPTPKKTARAIADWLLEIWGLPERRIPYAPPTDEALQLPIDSLQHLLNLRDKPLCSTSSSPLAALQR